MMSVVKLAVVVVVDEVCEAPSSGALATVPMHKRPAVRACALPGRGMRWASKVSKNS
mgnify:CR=1 FL=1